MDRVRVGVIGVGHLGRHHARILAGLNGVELVAVADARQAQAEAVAGPLGARALTDYRDLIGLVDAVSVATPTSSHREVAGTFLERGIPTLVEKPLAADLREAEELVALARKAGVVLQVGHIERFNPAFQAIEQLGWSPRYIDAERGGVYTFRSTDISVVHDLMIHDLDLVLALNPAPVRSVSAVGVGVFSNLEDVASARIEFEDGSLADIRSSRASFQAVRKMRVWSSEGYAAADFATKSATLVRPSDALRAGRVDLDGVDLSQPTQLRDHLFGTVLEVEKAQPAGGDQLTAELQEFVDAVRGGPAPVVTGEIALRAVRVADLVTRAMQARRLDPAHARPSGPHAGAVDPIGGLAGPKFWKARGSRAEGRLAAGD